jgi:F420H(2)-dependent quinone reductase
MDTDLPTRPNLPPAWFKHLFWRVHRVADRLSGGRLLWRPGGKRGWGALRLTTIGRRSGEERSVIVGYIEDGPVPVVMAMNGWDEGHPSWWLNLEAHPDAVISLPGRHQRLVRAHAATGAERDRLWARWAAVDHDLDAYAAMRSVETPVVVLEPRDPES